MGSKRNDSDIFKEAEVRGNISLEETKWHCNKRIDSIL